MRERLIFLLFLFVSASYGFEYGGQKFLTKDEEGESNDDLADAEVRSIIAAIVDAILDGDRRKRSEIKDDDPDTTSTSTSRLNNGKYVKKLNISLDTKDTVPSPKNSSLIEIDIDDSLKVLNLDAKKKSDVVASKAISEDLLDPRNTNLPVHPLNYSAAAAVTPPIDLPSLNSKQTIGVFKHAAGPLYKLSAQLEKENSESNAASQAATEGSGSGEADKETGNQFDAVENTLSSEASGSGEADVKPLKQNFVEDSSAGRTSEASLKSTDVASGNARKQKLTEKSNAGDVTGSADASGSGDVRNYEDRKDEVVDQKPKQYYMKKDSLLSNFHRQVIPVSVHNTSEEDGGSGSGDEANTDGKSTAADINYDILQDVRRSDIPARNNDVRRSSNPTTFTVYNNPEQAGSHVSYYTSNVLKVNHLGASKDEQLPTVTKRSDIIADTESSGSGGDVVTEDAASTSSGGGTVSKTSDVASGTELSGSGSKDVAQPKLVTKEEDHNNKNDNDNEKRQVNSDSDISGSAESENNSDKGRVSTLPKEEGEAKSVAFHALGENHSGEGSGFSESGDFDTTNGFSASGEPEADNYGDIGPDYKAYNRRNTARRRGIDDRNFLDPHAQSPIVTYSIPRGQHVSYYKEGPPDDVINIPDTREMGSVKATDIQLNNVKEDKGDALTIVSATDDTAASGTEIKAEIEMSNDTTKAPIVGSSALVTESNKENSTKRESGKSLSDTLKGIGFTNKSHPVSHDKNGFKNDTVHVYVNKDGKVHNKTSHKQYLENNKDANVLKKVSSKIKADSKINTDGKNKRNSSTASAETSEAHENKDGGVKGSNGIQLKKDEGSGAKETEEKAESEGEGNMASKKDNQTMSVDDNNEKSIANIEAELVDDSISDVNKKNINESTGHHDDEKTDTDDKSGDYIKDAISSAISSDSDSSSGSSPNNDTPKDSGHTIGSVVHIKLSPDNKDGKAVNSNTPDIHLTNSQLKNDSIHVSIFPNGKIALNKEGDKKEKDADKKHKKKKNIKKADATKGHIDVTKVKNNNGSTTVVEFYHNKTGMYETGKSYSDLDLLRNHSFFASENGTVSNLTLYKYLHTNRWSNETANGKNGPLSESPYSYLDQSEGRNATGDAIIKNLTMSKDYMEEDNSTIEHEGMSNETNSNETRLGQFIDATNTLVEQGQQMVNNNGGSVVDVTESLNGTDNINADQNSAVNSNTNTSSTENEFSNFNNNVNTEQNGSVNSNNNLNGAQNISMDTSGNFNNGDQTVSTDYNVNGDQTSTTTSYSINASTVAGFPGNYHITTNGAGGINGNMLNGNGNGNNNVNNNVNGDQSTSANNNISNVDQAGSLNYDGQPGLGNGTDSTSGSTDELSPSNNTILNADEGSSNVTHNDSISSYQSAIESDVSTSNETDSETVKDEPENKTETANTDFSYLNKNPRPNVTDPTVTLHHILAENDTNDNSRYLSENETDSDLGNSTEAVDGANVTSDDGNNVTSVFVDSTNESDANNTSVDANNTLQMQSQPNAQLGTQPPAQPDALSNAQSNAQPDALSNAQPNTQADTNLNTQADQTVPPTNTNDAQGGVQLSNSSVINQFEPLNRTENEVVYNQEPIKVKNSEQVLVSTKNATKKEKKGKEKEAVNVKVFSSGVTNVYVDHKGNVDVRRVDKKNTTNAKNKTKPAQKSAKILKGDDVIEEDLMKADPKNEYLTHDKEPKKKEFGAKNGGENMNLNITTFENAKIDQSADDFENDSNVYVDTKAFTKNITHSAKGGHTAAKNTTRKTAFKVKSVNMTFGGKIKGSNKTTPNADINKKNDSSSRHDMENNSDTQKSTHNIKNNNTTSKINGNKNNVKSTASKSAAGAKNKKNFDVFGGKVGEKNSSGLTAKDKTNPVTFNKNSKDLLHHNEKATANNVNKNASAHNISASDVSRSALTIVEDLVDIINSTHGKNKKNGSNSDKAAKQKITRYTNTRGAHARRHRYPAQALEEVTRTTVSGINKQGLTDRTAYVQREELSSTVKRHHLLRHRKGKKGFAPAYSPVSLVKRDAYEMTSSQDGDDTDEDEVEKHSSVHHGAARPRDANAPFDDSNQLVKKSSPIPAAYDVEIESSEAPIQQTTQGQILDAVKGNAIPTSYSMEMTSRGVPQQAYVVEQKNEPVIVEEVDPVRLEAIKKSEIPDEYVTVQPVRLGNMNYKKSQIPSEYGPEVVEPSVGDNKQLPEVIESPRLLKGDAPPEYVSAEAEHLESIKKGQIASEYISEAVQPDITEAGRKSDILPEYVSDEQTFVPTATKKHSRAHIPQKDRTRKVKLQELAATSEVANVGNPERSENNQRQYLEKRDKIWTDDHEDDNGEESNVVDDTDDDNTANDNLNDGTIVKTDADETPSELRSNILNMLSSSETTMSSSSSPSTEVSKDNDKHAPTLASGGDERTDAESGSAENVAITSGEDTGSAEPTDESSPSINTKRDTIARNANVMGDSEDNSETSETTEISRRNNVEKETDLEKSSEPGNPDISGSGGNSGSGSEHESNIVRYGTKKKTSDGARESIVKKLVNEMAHAAAGSVKEGAHVVVKKSNIFKGAREHEVVKRSRLSEEEIVNYSNNKDIHAALKMLVNSLITKGPGKSLANEHLLRVKRMETEEKLENDIFARSSIPKNSSLTGETKEKIVQGVRDFEGLGEELSQSDFLTPYKHDVIANKLEGDLVKNLRLDKEQSATIYKEEDDLLKATEMEFIKDKIDREFSSSDGASRGDKINAIKRTIKSLPLSKEDSDDLTKSIQESNWLGVESSLRKKKAKVKHAHA